MTKSMTAAERKAHPVFTGVLKYFPNALMEVAEVSKVGNDQHNPGEPLHWAKEKSTDEGDALVRHQLDAGTRDTDGMRHSAKVAWRALAQLEREILAEQDEEKEEGSSYPSSTREPNLQGYTGLYPAPEPIVPGDVNGGGGYLVDGMSGDREPPEVKTTRWKPLARRWPFSE